MKNARRLFVVALAAIFSHVGFLLSAKNLGWLTEPIPVHWGANLQPDRFVSLEQHLIELAFIQIFALLFLAIGAFSKRRLLAGLMTITGIGVFLLLQFIVWATTLIQLSDSQQGFPFNLFLSLLALPLLLVLLVLQVPSVTVGERLVVKVSGLPLLSVEYSDIAKLSVTDLRARDYGGLGIRYSRGKLAFIPRNGRGLELKLRDGESVVIYSTQPEILQSVISNKLEK